MDYEWHGGSAGPVDFTSPFSQVRKQPQQDNKKRMCSPRPSESSRGSPPIAHCLTFFML